MQRRRIWCWFRIRCKIAILTVSKRFRMNFVAFLKKLFFLYWHFLLTLKPNADETDEKTKYVFYKCVLNSHFTLIFRSWRIHVVKKVKSYTLMFMLVFLFQLFVFCYIFEISKKIGMFPSLYFPFYSLTYFSTFKLVTDFIYSYKFVFSYAFCRLCFRI
jgi:hypothetical protein